MIKTTVTFVHLVEAKSEAEALRQVEDQDAEGLEYAFELVDPVAYVSEVVDTCGAGTQYTITARAEVTA